MPKILQFSIAPVLPKVYTKVDTFNNTKDMMAKVIGIKNFRDNITKLWKTARDKKITYIVMYHSSPVWEVKPVSERVNKPV